MERKGQTALLGYTLALFTIGLALAFGAVGLPYTRFTILFWAAFTAMVTLAFWLARRLRLLADPILFFVPLLLAGVGLIELYTLQVKDGLMGFGVATKQMAWLGVGLVTFLAVSAAGGHYAKLRKFRYGWAALGTFLLGLTIPFGQSLGGARAWIVIGTATVQPSEFVKILMVLFLAAYLAEQGPNLRHANRRWWMRPLEALWYLGPLLFVWGLALLLLIAQRDLGTAVLYFGVFLALIYLVSGRFSFVLSGGLVAFMGGIASLVLFGHVRQRVRVWLDPWSEPTGAGYQIVQSLFALGSGGITGVGFGLGAPERIPAAHTDFIFAALGEEIGLAGGLAILALFLIIATRGLAIARHCDSSFGYLLGAGLSLLFAWQVVVIIGGVVRLFPLTGVTLPFVSYGGSSLVSSFATIGMLQGLARERTAGDG